MAGRRTQQPVVSDAEAQRQQEATRKMRLECLKIAVEMRTGTTKAVGLINEAEKLGKYVNTGRVEES